MLGENWLGIRKEKVSQSLLINQMIDIQSIIFRNFDGQKNFIPSRFLIAQAPP